LHKCLRYTLPFFAKDAYLWVKQAICLWLI
jgi:hypothetical protein